MWVSCTQWLLKPAHLVQDPYAVIECKQAKCSLLEALKHVCNHQNFARRTGTRLCQSCIQLYRLCLKVRDVITQFCKATLTICLSSRALLVGGRWDPACRSVFPSATHWFYIRMIMDGCRSVWRAISRNDNPHSPYRQRFCLYRISALVGKYFFLLFEVYHDILCKFWP